MARSYPYLSAIQDPAIQGALRVLFDQIGALQEGNQAQKGPPDMGGNRVRRVAAPEEDDDAVPLQHLNTQLAALEHRVTHRGVRGMTGRLPQPQVPFLRNIPDGPLPDPAVAQDGEMIRHQGVLKFFNALTRVWEDVV